MSCAETLSPTSSLTIPAIVESLRLCDFRSLMRLYFCFQGGAPKIVFLANSALLDTAVTAVLPTKKTFKSVKIDLKFFNV